MASTGVDLDLTLSQDFLNGGILADGGTETVTSGGLPVTIADGAGVNAYAVLFDNDGFVSETTLVSNGTLGSSATVNGDGTIYANGTVANSVDYGIQLVANGNTLDGGKLYIVVQSIDPANSASMDIADSITSQSFINATNATTYDFSYDSFEATLDGTATDAANLTSVNGFALPMDLSVDNDGTTSSVGYNVPGSSIVSSVVANVGTDVENYFTAGALSGRFSSLISPTGVNQPGTAPSTTEPYAQAGWASYVQALQTIAPSVTISGQFLGAPDSKGIWHNAGYYAYTLSFDGTNFWLVPTAQSQVQGAILLTPDDIEQNIFSQVGSVSIYTGASMSDPLIGTVGVGDNTQWGAILAQFLTGFTAGYYGQAGVSLNPQITGTVSLDQNNNWNPSYAFRQDTDTIVSSGTGYAFDPYSDVFYKDSNSYGSPYTDALMSQYTTGGPLLDVANSGGTDVSTIDLTIFGQDETPSGYTTPTIYDYISPGGAGTYAIPDTGDGLASLTFSFYARVGANAGISLNPDSELTVGFLASDANGSPVWNTVTIDGAGTYVVNGDTFSHPGLWHIWNFSSVAGEGWVATPVESSGTLIAENDGSMVVNLPRADSGVSWYQVTVGADSDAAKTYNLYTTTATVPAGTDVNGQTVTVTTDGVFENPTYTGQAATQAVDGLATISGTSTGSGPTQYTNTLTVNFATGATVSYNPGLVVENTGTNNNLTASGGYPATLPSPPVVVISQSGTLAALSGAVITPGTYSGGVVIAGTVTAATGALQFGWAGYDTEAVTVNLGTTVTGHGWTGDAAVQGTIDPGGSITGIGAYTDKTNAWDDAVIIVGNSLGQEETIVTRADADGDWLSNAYNFGVGSYTLSMYDAIDNGGTLMQVTGSSEELILNVETASGGADDNAFVIACFAAGTRITTPAGPVAVEALAPGDAVLTLDGAAAAIRWIGHRVVDCARHPRPAAVWPVRIVAGAFGPGAPLRDLYLSPDHAVFAEGALVPVKHLINGHSVMQQRVPAVTYFHIDLARHDVLLAEGLPTESYLDSGDRLSFANGGAGMALHPTWGSEARDIALFMDAVGYAPLTVTGPVVDGIRARLAAGPASCGRAA